MKKSLLLLIKSLVFSFSFVTFDSLIAGQWDPQGTCTVFCKCQFRPGDRTPCEGRDLNHPLNTLQIKMSECTANNSKVVNACTMPQEDKTKECVCPPRSQAVDKVVFSVADQEFTQDTRPCAKECKRVVYDQCKGNPDCLNNYLACVNNCKQYTMTNNTSKPINVSFYTSCSLLTFGIPTGEGSTVAIAPGQSSSYATSCTLNAFRVEVLYPPSGLACTIVRQVTAQEKQTTNWIISDQDKNYTLPSQQPCVSNYTIRPR